MKDFRVHYSLEELDSFVDRLKEEQIEEFSFENSNKSDGQFILFSFVKDDASESTQKMIKVMSQVPLPYAVNDSDSAIFTALCFALKYKVLELEIYGICNIKVNSENKGAYHNKVVVSGVIPSAGDQYDLVFPPDLNSLTQVFKSIKKVDFNDIVLESPLRICNSPTATTYKWSLAAMLGRFNFKNIG